MLSVSNDWDGGPGEDLRLGWDDGGAGLGGDGGQNANDEGGDGQPENSTMGAARNTARQNGEDDSNAGPPENSSANTKARTENRDDRTITTQPSIQDSDCTLPATHITTLETDVLSIFLSRSQQPQPTYDPQHTTSGRAVADISPTPDTQHHSPSPNVARHNTPSPLPSTRTLPHHNTPNVSHRTPDTRWGTASDTDIATLLTYPPARYGICPLHTGCGRPIVDSSVEYWGNARRVGEV